MYFEGYSRKYSFNTFSCLCSSADQSLRFSPRSYHYLLLFVLNFSAEVLVVWYCVVILAVEITGMRQFGQLCFILIVSY